MTDEKSKKEFTVLEIAKMKPEEAILNGIDRISYMELRGMRIASYADGFQARMTEVLNKIEQEIIEKEMMRNGDEQVWREEVRKQMQVYIISMLKKQVEAGIPKDIVAQNNKMHVRELEKLLAEESL